MQLPLLLDRSGAESLTDQIAGQLRQAIASAQLAGGVRLPSSRRLAEQLEVARNTVMRAYDTLMAEGWVELRPASGLFVAASEPARSARAEPSPAGAPGRSSWSMPLPALPNPPARARGSPARPAVARFRAGPRPPRLVSAQGLAAAAPQAARARRLGRPHRGRRCRGPARFALGDRRAPCDHPRPCGGPCTHSHNVRRPGGRRPRGAPFPASRHDRGNRGPLPGKRGDGLRGDRLRGRRRGGRRRRAHSRRPAAARDRPSLSHAVASVSDRPCAVAPNGARPSPPGRGAAADTFSRTISTASSGSKARRSRRSRRPLRTARSIWGPSRARSARASSSASWSCRRGSSRRARWPSACSTAAAHGSSRLRSPR